VIRRDRPLGAATPERWVLVSQPEHARVSGELARLWGGENEAPLVCSPDEAGHPLAAIRHELIAAIDHHDDGWIGWSDAPAVDPESGRPYSFTEMPTGDAQRIWSRSIQACRAIGPLAGWVVASHFYALQSKRDDDYHEWEPWLAGVDVQRAEWLAAWSAEAPERHTPELAHRCLARLQAFDWISLWLCCRQAALPGDRPPPEPLVVGDDPTGWPPIRFEPAPVGEPLRVSPWPLATPELELSLAGRSIPVGVYRHDDASEFAAASTRETLSWRLVPGRA